MMSICGTAKAVPFQNNDAINAAKNILQLSAAKSIVE